MIIFTCRHTSMSSRSWMIASRLPKRTRQIVKDKYHLVKRWDRAGRMAGREEFNNSVFDASRFSGTHGRALRDLPLLNS